MKLRRFLLPERALLALLFAWGEFGVTAQNTPADSPPTTGARDSFPSPGDCRILKIIHSWPDGPAAQDALIQTLKDEGFGGVVCNVSFTDYLTSEAKWSALRRAVTEAKQAGFSLWLYDEKGYPSGTAGGIVLRGHQDWEARGLLIADAETQAQAVELTQPPGEPFLAAAFPVVAGQMDLAAGTNLASQVQAGKLSWQPPQGRWHVMLITESRLFEGTHASLSLSDHIPYPNLLQAEPTERFLEITHQDYARHLGEDLGHWFKATFTDEPSLMSLFLKPMPYRVLPWSPGLRAEFEKRCGYGLLEVVPALVADSGERGRRARYDYWRTVRDLVAQNYFGQIQAWCAGHHLQSGGHLLMEENLVNQVPLYGDFFTCLRRLDAPGIDCLTSLPDQVPWYIARLAGSAADLEGRPVTMCETSDHSQRYRPAGDTRPVRKVTENEIRGTCNRLMVNGINTITSYYSYDGLNHEQLRRLNEWVGRCCAALRGGSRAAPLAVLYPTESVWPCFSPAKHYANDSAAAARIETVYHEVSEVLFEAGRDFTYVDARALSEAKVEAGALVHRALRWRAVILPGADTLPLPAWENLAQFVRSGGILIAVGALPANSGTEFPSPRVQALATEIFGDRPSLQAHIATNHAGGAGLLVPAGAVSLLPLALNGLLEADVQVGGTHSPLRSTHRRRADGEVFFVINDSDQPWSGRISLAATGPGEECDPASGQTRSLSQAGDLELNLRAYGGALFRFGGAREPRRWPAQSEPFPNLAVRELPWSEPHIARGEFVREKVVPAPAGEAAAGRAWQITGRLTKGQVDTFLFASFSYPDRLGLQEADALVFDVRVPEGQHSSAQLLAILHQQNGADYLAMTSCLLGAPGPMRICLPLSRFQLAGWSKNDRGHLDPGTVTEIRLGWGGYYGAADETLQFTLSAPQVATLPY